MGWSIRLAYAALVMVACALEAPHHREDRDDVSLVSLDVGAALVEESQAGGMTRQGAWL